MKQKVVGLVISTLMCSLLGGCGESNPPAPIRPASTSRAIVTQITNTLTPGSQYFAIISGEDLADVGENYSQLVGKWEISLVDAANYILSHNGERVALGQYRFSDDRLSFNDLEGPGACIDPANGSSQKGTYLVNFQENKRLSLMVESDECGGRILPLTLVPFTFE